MAVLKTSEIMEQLKEQFKENNSDEVLKLLEDISDTMKDFEDKTKGDGEDWKKKFEQNDAEWRQRYKERFFQGTSDGDGGTDTGTSIKDKDNVTDDTDETHEPLKFEDLFTEKGKE